MNIKMFKTAVVAILSFLIAAQVHAQKKPKPKPKGSRAARSRTASGYGQSAYGNTSAYTTNKAARDTTKKKNGSYLSPSGYGNSGSQANVSGAQPVNQNLPVKLVKGSGSGISDSVAPSLRNDNAVNEQQIRDRSPLPYQNIREDDAVFKQRVWREIDTREKMNLPFRYAANEDNGNQRFISILYSAVQSGDVTVFSGDDDRFTTPMTKEEVSKVITGGLDTVPVTNLEGEVVSYEARQKMIDPDSIYRYRLKEEWIFDKETSRMYVRILGIAPIMTQYASNGVFIGDRILFWVYYPDLRSTLAKYEVYNGKNYAGRMSWEELFESRFFSSTITKSTLNNPFDKSLKDYIKDPLFRLLEGENIKEKIFNYEQDLWSY